MRSFDDELLGLSSKSLKRELRWVDSAQGNEIVIGGKSVINFSSNDYLGLASHPEIIQAMKNGADRWGVGSTSSRLVTGSMTPHGELENFIAELKGCEAALSFSSGYAASVATIGGLVQKGDTVIIDKLAHASLIDGAKLSGAKLRDFPHNNLTKLKKLLESTHVESSRVLIITESVFSMDGDVALLKEIVSLKKKYGALLLVDEAHGLGVFGATGLGLIQHCGEEISKSIDVHMGTLGKAAGVAGGYIAGAQAMIDLVINRGRAFIYSTAPPPALAVASLKSLEIITSSTGNVLREKLWDNIHRFSSNVASFREIEATSAIIPWRVGEAEAALELSAKLLDKGFYAPAIRYPTVARDEARLRITVTAKHSDEDLQQLADHLKNFDEA